MPHELTNAEKIRKLPWSLTGDALNVVYFTICFTGPIFLLYLSSLGLSTQQIGLLLAVIPFTGLIAPFIAPFVQRAGVRRVFLTVWSVRKFIMAFTLLAPWVIHNWGPDAGFAYIVTILTLFSICRSLGENGFAVWSQEFVPQSIRGKYQAMQMIVIMLGGAGTVGVASWLLGSSPKVEQFQGLFIAAFFVGLLSVVMYARMHGGAPVPDAPMLPGISSMLQPLRNRLFLTLVVANAFVTLAWIPMTSLLPLFFRDHVHLPTNQIVQLDAAFMIGALCSSFLWGWAADRYGSKPVMITSLTLHLIYPVTLLFLPQDSHHARITVLTSLAVLGLVAPGWGIAYGRYLFVNVVPKDQRSAYTAMHTAWCGLWIGFGPIIAGQVLKWTAHWSGMLGPIELHPHTPLFLNAIALLIVAVIVLTLLPSGGSMPATRFAMMFMQGNPLAAMQAMVAFQYAGDEIKRISTIERMGQSRSPLSVEELVEALEDPSFNVRYEAIVSIARTRVDPRLTEAMVRVLRDGAPELQTTAAWALGRMGDKDACAALRQTLETSYPLLRARAARALGSLGDTQAVPRLHDLLRTEADPHIRVAFAASLASLGREETISDQLRFLRQLENPGVRREVSLAIATLLGRDDQALRLWRRMHHHPGDTLAGVMLSLRRRLVLPEIAAGDAQVMTSRIDRTVKMFGAGNMANAADELVVICQCIRPEAYREPAQLVIVEVTQMLSLHGATRSEYVFLAVHALHVGLKPEVLASTAASPLAGVIGN